ncbi:hypothetical protein [Klebsiella quasivariicola]|uniref:hypothetical protein n=1 Tax=Klebsiella quasivariicola TaxID=2026240 RepID=UPI002479A92C|nr:hypothetical protein [Klebsiella quasivariicola]
MHKTLLLDRTAWDLVLDIDGNIACATEPYSVAQDVATAVRTFLGECWYDTSLGVPYWEKIFGAWPSMVLVQSLIEAAALWVPDVAAATCEFLSFTDRQLTGRILITDSSGTEIPVSF